MNEEIEKVEGEEPMDAEVTAEATEEKEEGMETPESHDEAGA